MGCLPQPVLILIYVEEIWHSLWDILAFFYSTKFHLLLNELCFKPAEAINHLQMHFSVLFSVTKVLVLLEQYHTF